MTDLNDKEIFTIDLWVLLKHKQRLLAEPHILEVVPLLSSVKIEDSWKGLFGLFGGSEKVQIAHRYTHLQPNTTSLQKYLKLSLSDVESGEDLLGAIQLGFASEDYNKIKRITQRT